MENKIKFTILFLGITFQVFSLKPIKDYIYKPDSLKLIFEEVKLVTKDKAIINTWNIEPKSVNDNNNKVIIIAQSDAGNMSYLLYQAYYLSYKGYNVVLFDYRGFGESSDFNINENQLYYDEFVQDLKTVIGETKKKFKEKEIGVLAFSMGTIVANLVVKKTKIDFLILEGIMPNLTKFSQQIKDLKNKQLILPKSHIKYNRKFIKNLKKIDKVVVFHGIEDVFSDVTDLKKTNLEKIKIIEFDGGHLQGFYVLKKNYFGDKYIESFENFI